MYHSLIISGKNTFSEWGLVPTSRPVVNPPEVKTTYVDLPASHGVLDYTTLLLGEPPLGQRTGSWEFAVRPGASWIYVYESVMNYLHGKRHTVILEDDPLYQYVGRLTINQWRSDPKYSLITIGYSLDPYKYNVTSSEETDWLWNELFVDVIDARLEALQKDLLKKANAKQGFDDLADEIEDLRTDKEALLLEDANRQGVKQRLDELEAFLEEQQEPVTDYDEGLVRRLIERITVYDDRLVFEFKSGLETEVQM